MSQGFGGELVLPPPRKHSAIKPTIQTSPSLFTNRPRDMIGAPIHKLPNELLSEILHLVSFNSRDNWVDMETVLALSHICARWRAIALSFPQLWSMLVIDSKVHSFPTIHKLVDLWGNRSSNHPLSLKVSFSVSSRRHTEITTALLSFVKRLKALTIEGHSASLISFFSMCQGISAPSLTHIHIQENPVSHANYTPWIITPALRSLTLLPSSKVLRPYAINELRFLRIRILASELAECLLKLKSAPYLETLRMEIDGHDRPTGSPMVLMSRLSLLSFKSYSAECYALLLECLRTPSLRSLRLGFGGDCVPRVDIGVQLISFLSRASSPPLISLSLNSVILNNFCLVQLFSSCPTVKRLTMSHTGDDALETLHNCLPNLQCLSLRERHGFSGDALVRFVLSRGAPANWEVVPEDSERRHWYTVRKFAVCAYHPAHVISQTHLKLIHERLGNTGLSLIHDGVTSTEQRDSKMAALFTPRNMQVLDWDESDEE